MESKENFIALRKTEQLIKLPLLSRAIYAEIESLCKVSGICFATNAYFAEQFRVSNKTVSAHISSLRKLNMIEIAKNSNRNGSIRIIRIKTDAVPTATQQGRTLNRNR